MRAASKSPSRRVRVWSRAWLGIGAGLLLTAIGLAHLRVETLRLRYQRAEAQRAEETLRDEERRLSLELRQLRDPVRLEAAAARLGFTPPERIVRVPPYPSPLASPPANSLPSPLSARVPERR